MKHHEALYNNTVPVENEPPMDVNPFDSAPLSYEDPMLEKT